MIKSTIQITTYMSLALFLTFARGGASQATQKPQVILPPVPCFALGNDYGTSQTTSGPDPANPGKFMVVTVSKISWSCGSGNEDYCSMCYNGYRAVTRGGATVSPMYKDDSVGSCGKSYTTTFTTTSSGLSHGDSVTSNPSYNTCTGFFADCSCNDNTTFSNPLGNTVIDL